MVMKNGSSPYPSDIALFSTVLRVEMLYSYNKIVFITKNLIELSL